MALLDTPPPVLRLRAPEDTGEIRNLMVRVYPPPHGPEAVWSAENLRRHMVTFPEGQMVVAATGRFCSGSPGRGREAS